MHVLDLSHVLPGALICTELQLLGHRVTRVEAPHTSSEPNLLGAALQAKMRSGKKCVAMNLKHSKLNSRWSRLIRSADALVHAYLPETAERLGLTPGLLHAINPNLMVVALHGKEPLHDLNVQARLGWIASEKNMPSKPFAQWSVVHRGCLEILNHWTISRKRKRVFISISMEHTARVWQSWDAPLLHGRYPCYALYRGRDRVWAVAAAEPRHWKTLLQMLNLHETVLTTDRAAVGARGRWVRRQLTRALRNITYSRLSRRLKENPCCVEALPPLKPRQPWRTTAKTTTSTRPKSKTTPRGRSSNLKKSMTVSAL